MGSIGGEIYSNGDMCESWSRRTKLREGEKKGVKEKNNGRKTKSNAYLRIHTVKFSQNIYMYERNLNWNYQITKEAKPQLGISVYKMKLSVLKIGYI